MLGLLFSEISRGIVHRASMIDFQHHCTLSWRLDASMASVKEMLDLQRQIADRDGMTIVVVMRGSPRSTDWRQLRNRLSREDFDSANVSVNSTKPASLRMTVAPSTVAVMTVDEEGYVLAS